MRIPKKLLVYYAFLLLCIACILAFPSFISRSVHRSLLLCCSSLIPALFPFLAISGIWLDLTSAVSADLSLTALWISWICGYPIGTKTVCSYYDNRQISRKNALCLLACTANASPSFLLFAVSFKVFGCLSVGISLVAAQILLSLAIYFLFYKKDNAVPRQTKVFSFFPSLCQSVQNAAVTMLQICAFTVAFGIVADALALLSLPYPWNVVFCGGVEIMHGIAALGAQSVTPNSVWLVSAVVGLSGLCIWFQMFSFALRNALPIFPLVVGKLMYLLLLPPLTVFLQFGVSKFAKISVRFLFLPILLFTLTIVARGVIMEKNKRQRKYK